ncbi:glycoside hydrolase family 3 C-terminal domain-containing protein [Cellulomonas sp. Y8]|uniref:glycoside hydrolase family 3 C-terminal domain-containing protein n=1 Tax=Cellulomonas sp. Y8 TaxID=2591145 RepID=UPI003D707B40
MTDDLTSRELAAALTRDEMSSMMTGGDFWHTQGVDRLGIAAVMVTDGPHGLRKQQTDSTAITLEGAVPATCFPPAVTLASTWDRGLLEEVGRALGAETRAEGVAVLLGPGVNIQRHPLGGRNFEYLSEDPLLAGTLGAALVRGIQSRGVGASVKHFACNNQETRRTTVSADVDERTLREMYLAPFERVVHEAAPWTVMTANNRVNGVYASEHRELLTSILRDEWGFDGVVLSDWGSVYDRVAAVQAGLDLEMPANAASDADVLAALEDGSLAESCVRASAQRLIELVRKAEGALRDPGTVDHGSHHRLARRAAAAGTVLLTNDGMLPLDIAAGGRLAVIGQFASTPRYQGAGSSQVTPTRVDDALTALRAELGDRVTVEWSPGHAADATAAEAVSLRDDAVRLATDADVVVLFLGLPEGDEAEGADRVRYQLPQDQLDLLDALSELREDVVVVLANGSPVDVQWSDRVGAILETWLGGQAGGSAVSDVLLGLAEPAGRLAQSIPRRVEDNPAHVGWPGEEGHARYGEGVFVGYRYYDTHDREVAFPFGHGLSYTTFEHRSTAAVDPEGGVTVRVEVTNTGTRRGREVVQVYANHGPAAVLRPVHELVGFETIELEPGATGSVVVEVTPRDLAHWSAAAHAWVVPEGPMTIEVGASSRDIRSRVAVTLPGNGVKPPLTKFNSLNDWLEDSRTSALVRREFGVGDGEPLPGPLADPHVLKLVGTTTMAKFAFFEMGIDRAALGRLLEAVQRGE